jgi:hypothetical protein
MFTPGRLGEIMIRLDSHAARCLVAIVLALSATAASAQESTTKAGVPAATPAPVTATATPPAPAPAAEKMGRELNGHFFPPSHILDDPFSYTAFGTFFGLGSGNALGPTLLPEPPFIDVNNEKWYGYTGLGLGMLLNVRILEYLSVRAGLITTAYLGTGSGAALTIGTSARITGDIGVKGSLPLGDDFRIAATVDVSYGPVFALLLADGIASALDQCRADPASCRLDLSQGFQQQDNVTWTLGLSAAWAPTPYLGVIGSLQFIAPTKTGQASIATNGANLAAMIDFDAMPLVKWLPLGVSAAYQLTTGLGGNHVPTAQVAGIGFNYTGRKDLALGLEIDWQWSTLETQQVSTATLAWLNLRYYWN